MQKTILTIVLAALCLNFIGKAQSPDNNKPSQKQTTSGKVISANNNEALPGATIKITTTNQTILTNDRGEFTLNLANGKYSLSVYYLSCETKNIEIEVPLKEQLIIKLETEEQTLKEVEINTGYYTVKDKERTGSISRVTAETIAKQPVSNPLSALVGWMTGVNIVQNSGLPGAGFSVQIRGQNSLRTFPTNPVDGNTPLYIVDGVPFAAATMQRLGAEAVQQSSPLNAINPSDIESIEVLKDADATAIYGSRGANGVVLITTKKGKQGPVKVDLNTFSGFSTMPKKMNLLNTEQYMAMRNEAFTNDKVIPTITNAPDLKLWDTNRYTDWQEKLLGGTAHNTNAQLSLSGGSNQIRFLISGNYGRETSIFPGEFAFQKGSGHNYLQYLSTDQKFMVGLANTYTISNNTLPNGSLTSQARFLPPNAPDAFNADGTLNWANGTWDNPFSYLLKKYSAKTISLINNLTLSYQLTKGLTAKANLSYSSLQYQENLKSPMRSLSPTTLNPTHNTQLATNTEQGYNIEPQLNYTVNFMGGTLSALTGISIQQNIRSGQITVASGFSSEALMDNLSNATTLSASSSYSQYRYAAAFARINYSYKSKYILNLTGRRDGSSRFGPGKQWGNFGAIGTAWIFSEETFIKQNLPFLSHGKLRASYGITGSDQIGDYGYLDSYSSSGQYLLPGLSPTRLANPLFSWEVNKKAEMAFEAALLNNRLRFSIAHYCNRSSSQLIGYALPDMVGFPSVQANFPATVQNTGWEFELGADLFKTPTFNWSTQFTLTRSGTKLLVFPNIGLSAYSNTLIVGQSLSLQRVNQFTGVNPTTGLYTFLDVNSNNSIGLEDRKLMPDYKPIYGGIENSFKYKSIELSFFTQFVCKKGYDYRISFLTPGYQQNQPVEVLNRWTEQAPNSNIQRYTQRSATTNSQWQTSDANYNSNLSFIRLKNVSLSWYLPQRWQKAMHLKAARIYAQGQNLYTLTRYKGLDPEIPGSVPLLQTFTAGIQFTL